MLDLGPATRTLAAITRGVQEEQLGAPTPCTKASVGDLLDHVDGLSVAFAAAAAKAPGDAGSKAPSADASRLGADWRERIPTRLATLADAWRADAAWQGQTRVGGVDLPGEVAGAVAVNELLVHGWDIAVATGQEFSAEPDLLAAALGFVQSAVTRNPQGSDGLFGPPVLVAGGAPLLDRLVGLTGRDPAWRSAGRVRSMHSG